MGPFATHIFADLGADVIKIESAEGDSFRSYRPNRNAGVAGGHLQPNRKKRSIVLDFKAPADAEALRKLILTADVFVHSLRPKAIRKLGLVYDAVRAIKPDIIYCGAYGFGDGLRSRARLFAAPRAPGRLQRSALIRVSRTELHRNGNAARDHEPNPPSSQWQVRNASPISAMDSSRACSTLAAKTRVASRVNGDYGRVAVPDGAVYLEPARDQR